jgi:hypothetical protein
MPDWISQQPAESSVSSFMNLDRKAVLTVIEIFLV